MIGFRVRSSHKLDHPWFALRSPEFTGASLASEREKVLAFQLHVNCKCQPLTYPKGTHVTQNCPRERFSRGHGV